MSKLATGRNRPLLVLYRSRDRRAAREALQFAAEAVRERELPLVNAS